MAHFSIELGVKQQFWLSKLAQISWTNIFGRKWFHDNLSRNCRFHRMFVQSINNLHWLRRSLAKADDEILIRNECKATVVAIVVVFIDAVLVGDRSFASYCFYHFHRNLLIIVCLFVDFTLSFNLKLLWSLFYRRWNYSHCCFISFRPIVYLKNYNIRAVCVCVTTTNRYQLKSCVF